MSAENPLEVLVNHVVSSTLHVVLIDPDSLMPVGAGSGCFIIYKERPFFISVQHVTYKEGQQVVIDKGTGNNDGTNVFSMPTLNYVGEINIDQLDISKPVIEQSTLLDICFAEIREDVDIIQKELWFNEIHVKADNKRLLFTDLDYVPTKDEKYCFYGRIRAGIYGNELIQTDKLYLGIEYDSKVGPFERFILKDEIREEDHIDFIGTSGAPIISETGEPVAFVAHGYTGQKYIYAFSARELRMHLDVYIDMHPPDLEE